MKSTFAYCTNGMFYFRIFGYGLVFSDIHKFGYSFSERNGYSKYLKIGNIKITTLKPTGL